MPAAGFYLAIIALSSEFNSTLKTQGSHHVGRLFSTKKLDTDFLKMPYDPIVVYYRYTVLVPAIITTP